MSALAIAPECSWFATGVQGTVRTSDAAADADHERVNPKTVACLKRRVEDRGPRRVRYSRAKLRGRGHLDGVGQAEFRD